MIGATGDVGSGVSRWLAGRCRTLTLVARNAVRLERERAHLAARGAVFAATEVNSALARATLVIAAASTTDEPFTLARCKPGTILADAGYPKNLARDAPTGVRVFHAGMGTIAGGLESTDGSLEAFYRFPVAGVAHGCVLEGALLAIAGAPHLVSSGRGNIDTLLALGDQHGIALSPLFRRRRLVAPRGCSCRLIPMTRG